MRYLRARRSHGSVSVIAGFSFAGIALGVAALIIVMSVMSGFRHDLEDKMIGLKGHLFLEASGTPLTDYAAVRDRVAAVPGVKFALPLVDGQALASSAYASSAAFVRGASEMDLRKLPGIEGHLKLGSLDGFDQGSGLIIGGKLAEHLSLRIGDKITLIAPRGAQTPFGVTPRTKTYPVAGIFRIGMELYDNTYVFMPLDEAQAYFDKAGRADVIEVYLDDPETIDALRPAIVAAERRPMIDEDWRQLNKSFFAVLKVEGIVMFTILTIIVIVAALNIISGLIMLVQDKARAIAVLRTMGATRGAVQRIFLITGATIGVSGTLGGFALGLGVAANLDAIRAGINKLMGGELASSELVYISQLPSRVEPREVAFVVLMALGLSLAATIYPSWRAARLDPTEALRYE